MDTKGKKIKVYFAYNLPRVRINEGNTIIEGPFSPKLAFTHWTGGTAVFGYGREYCLYYIDDAGKVILCAVKDEAPVKFIKKEKEKFFDEIYQREKERKSGRFPYLQRTREEIEKLNPFPEYIPFFTSFITDDYGNVYVLRRPHSIFARSKLHKYDLFDKKGKFLYEVLTSVPLFFLRNGFIYAMRWELEEEYIIIKKFKITNWDEFVGRGRSPKGQVL